MGRHFHLSLFYQVYDVPGKPQQFETPWRDSHSVDIAPDGTIPVLFSLPTEIKRKFIVRADRTEWKLKVKEVGGGFRSFAAEYVLPAEEEPEKDPFEDESSGMTEDLIRSLKGRHTLLQFLEGSSSAGFPSRRLDSPVAGG
jgi:hypothetical protein